VVTANKGIEMRLIKKYENRSLYDTESSSYISLQDLKQYVIDHIEFQVVNAKGGEDITRQYLIQIILELECLDTPLFSKESLEQIIRFYGGPLQQWLQEYLQQSFMVVAQQQQAAQFANTANNFTELSSKLSKLTADNINAWQQWIAATQKK
jgi:polyhydroxyalkanoate synthesis repressor PhaR